METMPKYSVQWTTRTVQIDIQDNQQVHDMGLTYQGEHILIFVHNLGQTFEVLKCERNMYDMVFNKKFTKRALF